MDPLSLSQPQPLLVDTHCWLWLQSEPQRISPGVLRRLGAPETRRWLSVVSLWEIAIKHALGKLPLPEPPAEYVPHRMLVSGFEALAIEAHHALRVARLPHHHGDPFDRLLIAQAQATGVPVVTVDRAFEDYDVEVIWADMEPGGELHEPRARYGER
ncbi:MAG TPA: type II toxin-antitoxin system VapC family toxin [Thermoanaerobaculia bacterium]|nr:type II toxin-antitoxin system VapC family toxin [Thermoanaerobaculia bacterium]